MVNIDFVYRFAANFAKLAQESYTLTKKYVLDQFFNAFKNRYVILYDTVESEYDEGAGNIYGPVMTFDFMNQGNDAPNKIIADVTKAMESSQIGPYIHVVNVRRVADKRFSCYIQFKNTIEGLA